MSEGTFTAGGRTVTREDYLALTRALEFGDDTTPDNPAAHPRDLIDPLQEAMSEARDHYECPTWCDDCDEWERPYSCEPCHGSGCGPGTATGAYEECEWCAGSGTDHQPYTLTGTWRHTPHAPGHSINGPLLANIGGVYATPATDAHPLTMIGRR